MKRLLIPLVLALFMVSVPAVANAAQSAPPLSAIDTELIIKVRMANLWEMPAGQMAQEKSSNPRVQEAGKTMASDHLMLQGVVEGLAATYNLKLPTEPYDNQKSWLTEMAQASGTQFDSVFAQRLRAAHGLIFPVIAKARTSTSDPEIRKFATTANTIVNRHMTLLEATGMVDFGTLNDPTPMMVMSDSDGLDMIVALTLVPMVVAVAIFFLWFATGRNRRRPDGPVWSQLPDDEDDRGSDRGDDRRSERRAERREPERRRGGSKLFAGDR
ncbi:DUF4142 domain-containing protein [Actinocrispum sp. NPDC049592]|uniref:DUF4142 domain-containing protein n=1 Tax=Actinocrispum sp. NPDC049592 TaxID=3154835 RepID=UPI0034154D4B